MKKTTLLLLTTLSLSGFAQQKSTGDIILNNEDIPITANFTLDNATSKVTLVWKGPSDRWFGMGIGVEAGYGMQAGDALVFTTNTSPNVTDRNFQGQSQPPQEASQDWTLESNVVNGTVRTLTLKRNLVTGDSNDFQLPYATTNTISISCVRPPNATMNIGQHGGNGNVGYASGWQFATLGVEDTSLNATSIFPNPSDGNFTVKAKTNLQKISVYSQTGALLKTIDVPNEKDTELKLSELQAGIYLIELQNSSEKSWKKIIIK